MIPLTAILTLLIVFQVKHLICDYFLQTEYHLGKFKVHGWVIPMLSHTGVHGVATLIISLSFMVPIGVAVGLAAVDVLVHALIDKCKVEASRNTDHMKPKFWWLLGIDQMFHHLTHYAIIIVILANIT